MSKTSKMPRVVSAAPKLQARAKAEKKDRHGRWLRRVGWASSGVVPLVVLGWIMLGSPVFAVDRVVVSGQHRLTASAIENAAGVPEGTPLARVDLGAIEKRVRSLDAVASVTVSRGWPNAIRVSVVERTAAVAVKDGDHYVLLDMAGVQFDTAKTPPKGVMRLQVGLSNTEARDAALRVIANLPAALRQKVGIVRAPSAQMVALVLGDNRVIIWGNDEKNAAKAAAATALLKLPGRTFDVSSPEVVTRK